MPATERMRVVYMPYSMDQALEGQPQEEIVVSIPGGELNGQTLWVEDVSSFHLGERMAVFLEENEGIFGVVGGFRGKSSISINNMVSGSILLSRFMTRLARFRKTSKGGQK